MKSAVIAFVSLLAFLAALATPMYLTGNLDKEGFKKLLGHKPPEAAPVANDENATPTDPLTAAIKEKEAALKKQEEDLAQKEAQVKQMTSDLDALRTDLAAMQAQMEEKISQEDAAHGERLQEVAKSLSSMKPSNAADSLKLWQPDEAAAVLRLVKDRERGRILDAMGADAGPLLKALQEKKL